MATPVERLADAEPTAHLGDFLAALDLVQSVDDFFVAAGLYGPSFCVSSAGGAGPLRKSQIDFVFSFPLTHSRGLVGRLD